jgi:glycosyltransferase involved in cell wall biosynthesis
MKKISILICSYNSGEYIFNTIKSVLKQTYTNFELLILDNNSKDDTVKNIKSFQDERIKLFESKINY